MECSLCASNDPMMRPVLHVVLVYGDKHRLDYGVVEVSNQCTPKDCVWLTNLQSRILSTLALNSRCVVRV